MGEDMVISCDGEPTWWNPKDYYGLNASKMDGKNIDFVNYMTYWMGGENQTIAYYVEAAATALLQKYPPSTINLAIPMYDVETAWASVCSACPNVDPSSNWCGDTQIVSKYDAMHIVELVKFTGIGGIFPWMLSYDLAPEDYTTCGGNATNPMSYLPWIKTGFTNP